MTRIHRVTAATLLLSCTLIALLLPSALALEPGEIVTDRIPRAGEAQQPSDVVEGPPSLKAVRCDPLQSRRARRIIQELLLDDLPASYTLPDSCPFLPSLDMLARFEEGSRNKRRALLGGGSSLWECAHCSKRFQSEDSLHLHLQSFHMAEAGGDGSSLVCLADYCDVLDCFHRSVQFDPLTGAVLVDSYGGRGAGTGALYGSAASRARRMRLANEARLAEKEAAAARGPLSAAGVPGPSAAAPAGPSSVRSLQDSSVSGSAALSAENPLSHRCSHNSMAFAKSRCEAVLLQCFPFGASRSAASASDAAAAQAAAKLNHDLYDRFHAVFCAPLRCVEENDNSGRLAHANAVELVDRRSTESRSRLWTVLGGVLLVSLGLFYFFVWNLRTEFGWRPTARVGGGGHSTLGAAAAAAKAQRQQSRLAAWLGMQGKKRSGKIM